MDTSLSLGFTVNSGPLSQVNIDVISLRTAVQLATGVYGWFKGIERSQSLTQLLSASGAHLVTTTSFALEHYVGLREEHDAMRGVVIEKGGMRAVEMPKASTAISPISGVTCLRALTSCLLCLCTTEAATAMLQRLIPYALLQYEVEEETLEFEGPLLIGLKQWVSAVAVEEESNKFKEYLLRNVDQSLQQLQKSDGVNEIYSTTHLFDSGDEGLILGVLKWVLTPPHKRETSKYPTRSLRVWTAAAIMSQLGFTVRSAYWTVNNHENFERRMRETSACDSTFDVFLVVSHRINGHTDTMTEFMFVPEEIPLPRATLLLNIPWLAFHHVSHMNEPRLNAQFLRDAYKWAFDCTRKRFRSLHVDDFSVKLEVGATEVLQDPFSERYKTLFTPFSPHIHLICADPIQAFAPKAQDGPAIWQEWDFSNYEELFETIRTDSHTAVIRNFYTTVAIVLGCMYGICSQTCLDRGKPLGDDSEVAFNPDLLYENNCRLVRNWATSIGRALVGKSSSAEWSSVLFEMLVGAVRGAKQSQTIARTAEVMKRTGYIFGAQSHGFAIVSDVLVKLHIQPSALGYFHIGRGQLLNLPIDEQGFVRGSTYLPFSAQIRLGNDDQDKLPSLYRNPGIFPVDSTRLDAEPCWEEDPQTVVIKMRQMGVAVATLNIGRILDRRDRNTIKCSCGKYSNEVAVPVTENWYHILIQDLKEYSFSGMKPGRLADLKRESRNFLIDASHSEEALIYVLGIIDAYKIIIAEECLECAYLHHEGSGANQQSVIVIPHNNRMTEDTQREISDRVKFLENRRQEAKKRRALRSHRYGSLVNNKC